MIRAGDWEPTPPRPGSLDDAMARGFDPDTASLPDSNEPLDADWQGALDRSLEIVRHLRCGAEDCGERRCPVCDERVMCTGPEPAKNACAAHDDECQSCNDENPCRECATRRREAARDGAA